MSRVLAGYGQSLLVQASVQGMKYQDIRKHLQSHFRDRLDKFKARINQDGPLSDGSVMVLSGIIEAAHSNQRVFLDCIYPDGEDRLLTEFCAQQGVVQVLKLEDRSLLLREYQKAYLQHANIALGLNAACSQFDLEDRPSPSPAVAISNKIPTDRVSEIALRHLMEGQRSSLWMAKTLVEKRDALALLSELVKDMPIGDITKADARMVKNALQTLPKNRNKLPETKGLNLDEMLKMDGLAVVSVRTLNAYVSHFQTFFKWAVEQGFTNENVFSGMRFRMPKRDKALQRDAFTTLQLKEMFEHLTVDKGGLVPKEEHKWVTLIAMFTGARLNEVAQLGVSDLLEQDGVLCFSFTTDGDDKKHLKTEASKRLVPVHERLLLCNLREFLHSARKKGQVRLFPNLSYDKQNGYGRNVGRWFNESFLVKLDMKKTTLSFHCLRHTMNTQLGQKNVPEHLQKAILGHTQTGMSYNTYFKEGFLPDQLLPEINKFSF